MATLESGSKRVPSLSGPSWPRRKGSIPPLPDPCLLPLLTPAPTQCNSGGRQFKQSGEGSLKHTPLGQVTSRVEAARPLHTLTQFGVASHLLEFLGFDLHLLLQGRVGAPELHGLLVSEHHLLLHFPFAAFLGQGRARDSVERHVPGKPQGALPSTEPGFVMTTGARREQGAPHGPHPLLPPHPQWILSGPSSQLIWPRFCQGTAPRGRRPQP